MLAEAEGIGSMRGDLIAASIPVKYFAMVKVQGERVGRKGYTAVASR